MTYVKLYVRRDVDGARMASGGEETENDARGARRMTPAASPNAAIVAGDGDLDAGSTVLASCAALAARGYGRVGGCAMKAGAGDVGWGREERVDGSCCRGFLRV